MLKVKRDLLPFEVKAQPITMKAKPTRKQQWTTLVIFAVVLAVNYCIIFRGNHSFAPPKELDTFLSLCPQAESQTPHESAKLYADLKSLYDTEGFTNKSANWLSGAIQVPTESHDAMGPIDEDPRWKVFGRFHEYLLSAYPLM